MLIVFRQTNFLKVSPSPLLGIYSLLNIWLKSEHKVFFQGEKFTPSSWQSFLLKWGSESSLIPLPNSALITSCFQPRLLYPSGFQQRNRTSEGKRDRDRLVARIGLHNCECWLGKSEEIHRASCQEGQARLLRLNLPKTAVHRQNFFLFREASVLLWKPLLFASGPPRLSRMIFLT